MPVRYTGVKSFEWTLVIGRERVSYEDFVLDADM